MREIIFRAKMKNKNKWVYGDLLHPKNCDNNYGIYEFDGGCVKVKEETIGQFTGLFDKNGQEIYEGDIVKTKYIERREYRGVDYDDETELIELVVFKDQAFQLQIELKYFGFKTYRYLQLGLDDRTIGEFQLKEIEVVGNVYDNPEMLEGGEE